MNLLSIYFFTNRIARDLRNVCLTILCEFCLYFARGHCWLHFLFCTFFGKHILGFFFLMKKNMIFQFNKMKSFIGLLIENIRQMQKVKGILTTVYWTC